MKGKELTYKILRTEFEIIRADGSVFLFNKENIEVGDYGSPWVSGLESEMEDKPGWIDRVFSDPDEEAEHFVWGQLSANSEILSQVGEYWRNGVIPEDEDWVVDEDGVLDLTGLVVTKGH